MQCGYIGNTIVGGTLTTTGNNMLSGSLTQTVGGSTKISVSIAGNVNAASILSVTENSTLIEILTVR